MESSTSRRESWGTLSSTHPSALTIGWSRSDWRNPRSWTVHSGTSAAIATAQSSASQAVDRRRG